MKKLTFKSTERDTLNFTLRFPVELDKRIQIIIKETGMSRNTIINKMIRFALDNSEIEK